MLAAAVRDRLPLIVLFACQARCRILIFSILFRILIFRHSFGGGTSGWDLLTLASIACFTNAAMAAQDIGKGLCVLMWDAQGHWRVYVLRRVRLLVRFAPLVEEM